MTHVHHRLARWMGCTTLLLAVPLGAVAQPVPSAVQELVDRGAQAGVDATLMQEVVQRAEGAGVASAEVVQLLQPTVQLAEQGLPPHGVLQKALEGLAKRVPPARVHTVLQRLQTHTQQAGTVISAWTERPDVREMLGEGESTTLDAGSRDQLVESMAQARLQNAPPEAVQQLLESLPAGTRRRPIPAEEVGATLQALPELMRAGASPEASIQLLTQALDAGYGPTNLRQLPTAMRAAQQRNQRPVDVLTRNAARAIERGIPAADVLGRLFDGDLPGGPPGNVGGPPGNVPPGQGKPPDLPADGAGQSDGRGGGNTPPGGSGGQ